jgi:hypothetical protein
MLGPLDMSVAQCLKSYKVMAQRAFTPVETGIFSWIPRLPGPPRGAYSAASLADVVKDIVLEYKQDREALFANKGCCKTYVTSSSPMTKP